jgi:Ulp1 family protease
MSLAEAEYDFRSDPSISAEDKREMEAARTEGERRKSRDVISLDDDPPSTSITALLKAKYAASSPVPETVPETVPAPIPDKEKRAGRRTSRNPIPVNEPVIIVFDSLGLTHPNVFKALREYVVDEAREKRKMDLDPRDLHGVCAKVPIQSNYADCGVYLLHYVQRFLHEPERYLPDILVRPFLLAFYLGLWG